MFKYIFTNSFGILFSRILGFIRDLLTASILGANIYSDIFFVAFKFPNLFRRIFAEGAFTQAFIPNYAKEKSKIYFSTIILYKFLLFLIILSILVNIFSLYVTKIIAIGFDDDEIKLASSLVAICFYYLPLVFVVTFLGTLLQYKNYFSISAFSTALLNISLIIALLISKNLDKYSITFYLSWGVIIGGIAQVVVHLIAIKKVNIKFFSLKAFSKHKKLTSFYKSFIPAIIGNSTAQISAFIDTWLASFLSSGVISYLYYANRVFQLPLALFAIATSIALFPTISKALKKNNISQANQKLKKGFIFLGITLSVASIIGIVFANEIVWLLFERGEFNQIDTNNTAKILIAYLIGLIPFGLSKLTLLYLNANNLQAKSAKLSAISLFVNIIFSLILIKPFGGFGLALASSLSGFILFILSLIEYKNLLFLSNKTNIFKII